MKYLVDKYKECKDWNCKQSGGFIWKFLYYDKIDVVFGVCDVVMFSNVVGVGLESLNMLSIVSYEEFLLGRFFFVFVDILSSLVESEKESRCMRKKRKILQIFEVENEIGKVMKIVIDQGERIVGVMEKM